MKEHDIYPDLLRIVAAFFVILIHVDAVEWYAQPVTSYEWQILNLVDSIARWVVPVFFMVSGAYLLDPCKEITVKEMYSKHISRIVIALLFWGLFYQIYNIIDAALYKDIPFTASSLLQIPKHFILGYPAAHLWFLYRLIGLYMLTPVLRIYTAHASRKNMKYLLILYICIGSIIPCISAILKNQGIPLSISFKMVDLTGFVFYYIAGYYFRTYEISRKTQSGIYAAGITGAALTCILTSYYSRLSGTKTEDFYDNMMPGVIFMSLALFVGFKSMFGKRQFTDSQKSVISYISSCTFGIYLVHYIFVQIAARMNITCTMYNLAFFLPALTIIFFMLSLAAVGILKRIKPVSRYLI